MKSSVTRTELFAFWYWIEWKPSPSIDMSKPAAAQRFRLFLFLRLAPDEVADVRVVDVEHDHLGRAAGLAARLDRPGPGVGAAHEGHRSEASPPLESCSFEERIFERLMPDPEPPRKIIPSLVFQSRIDSIVSSTERMKHADPCGFSSNPTLNQTGELNAACWFTRMWVSSASNASPSSVMRSSSRRGPSGRSCCDAADHLFDRVLALGCVELAPEVLLRDDVGRVLGPALGELDLALLERRLRGVADVRVTDLPLQLVERVDARLGEPALDGEAVIGRVDAVDGWICSLFGFIKCSSPSPSTPVLWNPIRVLLPDSRGNSVA